MGYVFGSGVIVNMGRGVDGIYMGCYVKGINNEINSVINSV